MAPGLSPPSSKSANPAFASQTSVPAVTEKIRKIRHRIGNRPIELEMEKAMARKAIVPTILDTKLAVENAIERF